MINLLKIVLWILIPIVLFNSPKLEQNTYKIVSHEVTVKHPGEKEPVKTILEEIQNEEGLPIEYTMNVYSVICLEEVCKIIPVKLYWNAIGVYKKYELAEGETLEKYEADLFESKDYIKLQSILANDDSPFKDVYIDEILTVPDEHGNEDVDAVSGATALELDEKDTVPGAALTCFTLWHWANGNVISIIKNQTGLSASDQQLQDYILHENNAYFHIALRELQNRSLYTKPVIDTIIKKALKDNTLLRTVFNYLKITSPELYFYATKRLFFEGEKEQKLAAIQSLRKTNFDIPSSYLDGFSSEISKLSSYQEVSLLLGLMENKNPNSKVVIENVFPLLETNILIARRSYWFLKNQELNLEQSKQLQAFYEKYKSRL
ncbi:hypothetical protein Q4Q34_01615 [Flavivirga abyssicola]|uniref:hypothetical protein n=1 Tax=Flavivirga abyssicola TaxID=3063533 RepID=UPI0026E04531|nr:hypothetical protein [Flavivirga sp. MEBiC07777]WVK13737.1 hypothetical protein Q4Q34_01615 [Flavivirga sp. MEBiC07777]